MSLQLLYVKCDIKLFLRKEYNAYNTSVLLRRNGLYILSAIKTMSKIVAQLIMLYYLICACDCKERTTECSHFGCWLVYVHTI